MAQTFFEKPILNSPYGYPKQHWELDENGQPTNQIIPNRRKAEFITPIPGESWWSWYAVPPGEQVQRS